MLAAGALPAKRPPAVRVACVAPEQQEVFADHGRFTGGRGEAGRACIAKQGGALFVVAFHYGADSLALLGCEPAIVLDQRYLRLVQLVRVNRLELSANIGVTHNVVNGGLEMVGDADQCADIRFDVVVFIFVDGLLTDPDHIG